MLHPSLRIFVLPLAAAALLAGCSDDDADSLTGSADAGDDAPIARAGGEAPPPDAGSDAAAADAGSTSPRPPPLDPSTPSYEVPVSAALADFARYAVGNVEWRVRNGERRLEYTLPAELIGSDQRLQFKGPDGAGTSWTLQDDKFGSADCQSMEGQIVCNEKLAGIPIDADAVQQRVQAGTLAPERLQVTKAFQGDPIGILRFPAP